MDTQGRLIRKKLKFERDFTQTPNAWMRDEKLSMRARGVLGLLLTHETGFSVTIKALASSSPSEGVDAIRTAVQELEVNGYLRRHPSKRGGRFNADDWEICDPAEMGAPSMLTALDNPTRTALDETTRKKTTALDEPMRTALDDPTTRRTQVEEITTTQRNPRRAQGKSQCQNGHPIIGVSGGGTPFCAVGCPPVLERVSASA
jgi:hypothetical protein